MILYDFDVDSRWSSMAIMVSLWPFKHRGSRLDRLTVRVRCGFRVSQSFEIIAAEGAVEFDLSDLSCSCTAMYAIARERWNMIEQWMQDFQGDPLCCYDIVMHFIILYHIPNFEGFRHTEQPWSMRSAFLGDGVACLSYAEDLKTSIIEDRRPGSARPCRWMSQAPFQKSQWQHEETDALSF
jgi:hypothetical protein